MTPEERADKVFREIDRIARDYDHYEYGLPFEQETADRICGVIDAALREYGDERAAAEREELAEEVRKLRDADLTRGNVMGRIAILLFDDQNNVTDEQCVERLVSFKKVAAALYVACRKFAEWANARPHLLNDRPEGDDFRAVYNAVFDALEAALTAAGALTPESP